MENDDIRKASRETTAGEWVTLAIEAFNDGDYARSTAAFAAANTALLKVVAEQNGVVQPLR